MVYGMEIKYKVNAEITTEQFLQLLKESSLGERRPIEDLDCIEGMLRNSNLVVSAWHESKLIGIARSLTDFNYACYLSDLAVNMQYQKSGIGKALQKITQETLGPKCKLILISVPDANAYYQHIGYENNSRCWVLERNRKIR